MKGLISIIGILSVAFIFGGCSVTVIAPPETKIKAKNNLVDMVVTVNGKSSNAEGIDLQDVTIGDVFFSYIDYGTSTTAKNTFKVGRVTVHVDSAFAVTTFVGQTVYASIPILYDMDMTVIQDITNTFDFNSTVFNDLTKKKAN